MHMAYASHPLALSNSPRLVGDGNGYMRFDLCQAVIKLSNSPRLVGDGNVRQYEPTAL